jgi:DNA polymerase (family X)
VRDEGATGRDDEAHEGAEREAPTNAELARALGELADLLELKGEQAYRVNAYRRAATSVRLSPTPVAAGYREGRPPSLTGVGPGIAARLSELALTGRLRALEELREKVPPSLVELLRVPGVGPGTARRLWQALGISSLGELEAAAREGRLRGLRGLGRRTEEAIIAGISRLAEHPQRRLHMAEAHAVAGRVRDLLVALPMARAAHVVGSVRRMTETVGDIDIVLETDQPDETLAHLATEAGVARIAARDDLERASRVVLELQEGVEIDVMVVPPGRAGAALVHLTGSAAHNVRLRARARASGWSLSEHGVTRLPGETPAGSHDGAAEPAPPPAADSVVPPRRFATEEEVYDFLGLPLIPPELREDRGEIEAALEGRLPRLVSLEDLEGDCHSHSEWSDGHLPIERVAETARRRGYSFQVLTDHSQSLTIANGLDPGRVEEQRRIIAELNERFAREEAQGETPPGSHPDGFRLLHGCELEITLDGRLDYEDDLLAGFDVVVASLHVGRRQPRSQLMDRYRVAFRSPHVDIISHPSGRKIDVRPELDLDWPAFYQEAAEGGKLLEVNGSDERLDLDEHRIREALAAGCRFTIDSDAHYLGEFENVRWGLGIARRGWLEARDVANTLPREAFLAALRR